MRTKGIISLLLVMLVVMMSVPGCSSGKSSDNAKNSSDTKKPVQIEFWSIGLKQAFGDYVQGIINKYQDSNPNITINWVDVPGGEVEQKFLAALTAGNPPDLANVYGAEKFAAQGAIVNIDKMVTDEQRNLYIDSMWKGLASVKGTAYGIPWYGGGIVLMYNKAIFKEAGLDPEKPPKTYKEAIEMGKIIKQKTDKFGLSPCYENRNYDPMFQTIFIPDDIKLFNDDMTKAAINSAQAKKSLDMWVDAYKSGVIPPESVSCGNMDWINWFVAGRTAMIPAGGWIQRYMSDDLKQNLGISDPLLGDAGKAVISHQYLVIPTKSKHQKEALDFGLFISNSQNVLDFCKLTPIIPAAKEAAKDPFFKQAPQNIQEIANQIVVKNLDNSMLLVPPIENFNEFHDILKEEVAKALIGQEDSATALKNTEAKWNDLLAKKK